MTNSKIELGTRWLDNRLKNKILCFLGTRGLVYDGHGFDYDMKTLDQMTLDELRRWKPAEVDFSVIREMVDRIADAARPEKIILFGSYARDDQTEKSDVDLLIITESSEPPPQRSVPIYRLLRNFMVPVDIMVRTPDEIKKYQNLPFSFIHRVLREGITLYERKT